MRVSELPIDTVLQAGNARGCPAPCAPTATQGATTGAGPAPHERVDPCPLRSATAPSTQILARPARAPDTAAAAAATSCCRSRLLRVAAAMPPHQAQLLDLDDAALVCIIRKLGLARRTVMAGVAQCNTHCAAAATPPPAAPAPIARLLLRRPAAVCKRLKDLAQDMVHSYQQPGQTVMDAIELAQVRGARRRQPARRCNERRRQVALAGWRPLLAHPCAGAAPCPFFFRPARRHRAPAGWLLQGAQRAALAAGGPPRCIQARGSQFAAPTMAAAACSFTRLSPPRPPPAAGGAAAQKAAAPDMRRRRAGAHLQPRPLRHDGGGARLPAGESGAQGAPGERGARRALVQGAWRGAAVREPRRRPTHVLSPPRHPTLRALGCGPGPPAGGLEHFLPGGAGAGLQVHRGAALRAAGRQLCRHPGPEGAPGGRRSTPRQRWERGCACAPRAQAGPPGARRLLQGPDTRMVLRHCLLHVGAMVMAGALEMTDCTVKCCSDPVVGLPGTTLVMRRWGAGRGAAASGWPGRGCLRASLACSHICWPAGREPGSMGPAAGRGSCLELPSAGLRAAAPQVPVR